VSREERTKTGLERLPLIRWVAWRGEDLISTLHPLEPHSSLLKNGEEDHVVIMPPHRVVLGFK